MEQRSLDALRSQLHREHYLEELPEFLKRRTIVKGCDNCCLHDIHHEGAEWCGWHDRPIDDRPWVLLCGGALWMEKPEHMWLRPEERNAFFQANADLAGLRGPSGLGPEGEGREQEKEGLYEQPLKVDR